MDKSIIVAVIGLVGTLAAVVLTALLKPKPPTPNSKNDRRAGITGPWTGNAHQIEGLESEPVDFHVDFYLVSRNDNLTGDASFDGMHQKIDLKVTGRFVDDYTMTLEFNDKDPNVLRCGVIVFLISRDTRRLDGTFAGFATEMEALVHGTINLERKNRSNN